MLELFGMNVKNIPLSYYRKVVFTLCKQDSLDRFGTKA